MTSSGSRDSIGRHTPTGGKGTRKSTRFFFVFVFVFFYSSFRLWMFCWFSFTGHSVSDSIVFFCVFPLPLRVCACVCVCEVCVSFTDPPPGPAPPPGPLARPSQLLFSMPFVENEWAIKLTAIIEDGSLHFGDIALLGNQFGKTANQT